MPMRTAFERDLGQKFPIGNKASTAAHRSHFQIEHDYEDLGRSRRHRSEQYRTSSQTFSHFLRHVNGRLQVTQVFSGRLDFFTFLGIL
jgi:hypothetical protein